MTCGALSRCVACFHLRNSRLPHDLVRRPQPGVGLGRGHRAEPVLSTLGRAQIHLLAASVHPLIGIAQVMQDAQLTAWLARLANLPPVADQVEVKGIVGLRR